MLTAALAKSTSYEGQNRVLRISYNRKQDITFSNWSHNPCATKVTHAALKKQAVVSVDKSGPARTNLY